MHKRHVCTVVLQCQLCLPRLALISDRSLSKGLACRNAVQASTVQATVDDAISLSDDEGEVSAVEALGDVASLELHTEDMMTAGELAHTLNHFYIADKETFMAAQDHTVSFTELLLEDAATGFSLNHQALSESYVPVDPASVSMGGLGAAAGDAFDVQAIIRSALMS